MILKKGTYWFGTSEKESIEIYENNDGSYTVFHKNKKTDETTVLECKGCSFEVCIKTANKVFNIYACTEK